MARSPSPRSPRPAGPRSGCAPCGEIGSPALMEAVRPHARARAYRRGQFVVREGDAPDFMGLVLSGRVEIVKHGANGRSVGLRVLGPGDLFGVVPAVDGEPYPASVMMVDDGEVGHVDAARLRAILRESPDLALELLAQSMQRTRRFAGRVRDAVTTGVGSRLAAALLDLAGAERAVAVTRRELAELAGTTVETAIRITKGWERAGLLRIARGRIEILDPAGLRTAGAGG